MARRTLLGLSLAVVFASSMVAAQPASTAHITLGQAAAPLYGPWKFTIGDSPIDPKTGQPLWAEPGFDDSKWENVDLTPKEGAVDQLSGQSGYVPGWTAKGHPDYWGYAWYRIRVQVESRPGQALALAGPANADDAYQVFDNGILAGHFGDFIGGKAVVYVARPSMFPLTQPSSHGAIPEEWGTGPNGTGPNRAGLAESTRVLAFRFWMQPDTLLNQRGAGGMHSAPLLGEVGVVAARYQVRWLQLIRAFASYAALTLLFGLLAVVAFSLSLFDSTDRVYLWMGALFLLLAAGSALVVISAWSEVLSASVAFFLIDCVIALASAAMVIVWWVWFGRQRPPWLLLLAAGLAVLWIVSYVLGDEVFLGLVPHAVAVHFVTVGLVLRGLFTALQLWVVVQGIRRQGVEGWLALPVVVLNGINTFTPQLIVWYPFGVRVSLVIIASVLMAVVIALLLLRRLLQSVKRQREMALDVKQAQEVQQVILPESRIVLPGFAIESEYRPAREVGGDFFQIIPRKTDGSVLIVAGDVTGKGLKAGMLVALLVGAIRTEEKHDNDPAGMLNTLNQRLIGRGDAQATCLAMRIEADGSVTLANSGHMAPYLNGEPLPMEGALPLGMIEGAESSVMHFQLKADDRLMLLSDGVAEATDADGKLFGFERVTELLRTSTTAAEVASAAQSFGQSDDISVISVTRAAVREPVAA